MVEGEIPWIADIHELDIPFLDQALDFGGVQQDIPVRIIRQVTYLLCGLGPGELQGVSVSEPLFVAADDKAAGLPLFGELVA
jgi:hypothetical protein